MALELLAGIIECATPTLSYDVAQDYAEHDSVGLVQDGAPEMWSTMRVGLSQLKRDGVLPGWVEGLEDGRANLTCRTQRSTPSTAT